VDIIISGDHAASIQSEVSEIVARSYWQGEMDADLFLQNYMALQPKTPQSNTLYYGNLNSYKILKCDYWNLYCNLTGPHITIFLSFPTKKKNLSSIEFARS
jgi:hypothetical protein